MNKEIIVMMLCINLISLLSVPIMEKSVEARENLLDRLDKKNSENEDNVDFYFTMGSINEEITEIKYHDGNSRTIKKLEKRLNVSSKSILPTTLVRINDISFTIEYKVDLDENSTN